MRLRTVAALVAAAAVAAFATTAATAHHTGYWFYQGYLPDSNGTRTKLHGDSPTPVYTRISWAPCSTDTVAIRIHNDGSWLGTRFYYSFGCDQWTRDQYPEFHNNYGCQNPPSLTTIWANCRVGPAL